MLNRKEPPRIYDATEFDLKLKPCIAFTLDNGVPVYTIDAGSQEVLSVEWVFYAGNWYEEKNIVAATANFLLKNGTKNRNAFSISEHFEYYGAYLNRSCYQETSSVSLHCLNKHTAELLPVVAELITESIFPEEELQIYKKNNQQRLQVNLKKCDFVAGRLIDEYLFGFHHPYGKYTSAPDYEALERNELVDFYKRFYTEGHCMIFAAGRLPADLQEQLNKYFGSLPLNRKTLPAPVHTGAPATEKKYQIINDPKGVQGAIRMARPFPNRHHPDFMKVQVLNNIFGGFFGSRLMSNIREDKGYTYGIHSYLQNHIQQSAWMISTEAGRDVCKATIDEVYKEMKLLREEPVQQDELELVRNFMLGSILGDLDGPFQLISRWKNYILNNLDGSFFYKNIETVKTIQAEELQELAKKYFAETDFYELTVI